VQKKTDQQAVSNDVVSIRLACQAFSIGEICYRYQPLLSSENEEISRRLIDLTGKELDCALIIYVM
jgi:putative transposase